MPAPDATSFGSAPFQSRMASIFREQLRLLDGLIGWSFKESNRHILPFIGAIRDNCESMLLLQESGMLNELTLVSRVFVQRVINCCYLLTAESDTISKYFVHRPTDSGGEGLRDAGAEAFLESASNYKPSEPVSAFALSLREQAEEIEAKTGAPKETFFVALASVFPKSSEILAGSLYGNVFQFGTFRHQGDEDDLGEGTESFLSEELSAALFLGVGLLDTLFRVLGKREPLDAIRAGSAGNLASAAALMTGTSAGPMGLSSYADGAWERLNLLELKPRKTLTRQLRLFEKPFEDAYEAGLIAPTLEGKIKTGVDVKFGAIYLKRVLNDLRGVWSLLRNGYTSQAASVAASLYESALATICLLQNNENAETLKQNPYGAIPWGPKAMAKMVVRGQGRLDGTKEFENAWRALYGHYVWLCQIKHCTPDSVIHDTKASRIEEKGYLVMAIPNVRDDDISTKATVAVISILRTLESIRAFTRAIGFKALPETFGLADKHSRAFTAAWQAFEALGKSASPVSLSRTRFAKVYPPVS